MIQARGGGGPGQGETEEGVRSDGIRRVEPIISVDGVDVGWETERHLSGLQGLGLSTWKSKPLEAPGSTWKSESRTEMRGLPVEQVGG